MAARQIVSSRKIGIAMFLIPLTLSGFTHLFNPAGFPDIFYDEGVYMRRAMHVIDGFGPQEGAFYDHPYFGQLFLGGLLKLVSYPDSLNPTATSQSIASLYAVPRLIMGILALADTLLIYKIAERRYCQKTAFVASILFAVMPMTWLTRRILLDSILLPFFLSSILFALYSNSANGRQKWICLALSGACLGLAIFTKAPMLTMIPLVGYIIGSANWDKIGKLKRIGIWIIPVISIPLIWPAFSAGAGQLGNWMTDVIWQTQRSNSGFLHIVGSFLIDDPTLLLLGTVSFVYCAVKRDFFVILWTIPFVAFLVVIGYVQYFYWIPLLPVFCIEIGILIERIARFRTKLFYPIVAGLGMFGIVSTSLLITTDLTSAQYDAAAYVSATSNNTTTIVASPVYSWLFIYVFKLNHSFTDYRDLLFYPVETKKLILISDPHFLFNINAGPQFVVAYNTTAPVATFTGKVQNYDLRTYPYTNFNANYEGSHVEIRARN